MKKISLWDSSYYICTNSKLGKRLFNMYKADRHLGSVYGHFLLGISEDLSLSLKFDIS